MPYIKQTSSSLFAFQQDLEALLKATPSLLAVFELNGKVLAANDAAAHTLGYSTDRFVGKNIFKIFKFAGKLLERQVLQVAESHDVSAFEGNYHGRAISCTLYPIVDPDKKLIRIVLLAEDNTDQRQSEEQVRALSQQLIKSQEDQFHRLGKELHDHIGQDLTALNINLSRYQRV